MVTHLPCKNFSSRFILTDVEDPLRTTGTACWHFHFTDCLGQRAPKGPEKPLAHTQCGDWHLVLMPGLCE